MPGGWAEVPVAHEVERMLKAACRARNGEDAQGAVSRGDEMEASGRRITKPMGKQTIK